MNIIKTLKSLSDETRLRIFRLFFKGIFNVNEILYIIGGNQSNISHHLKVLQDSELILGKKEGAQVFYRLNDFDNGNGELFGLIKKNEKEIPLFNEDSKRVEAVLEMRKKSAEEYFDSIGEEFDNVQANLFEKIYSVEKAASLFEKKMKTIIDVGCGTGRNLSVLAKYATKIIGIDASPKMIQLSDHIAKKSKLTYELKIGDVNAIPAADGSVDGIFANMVLHHISDPAGSLKEFSRVLSKEGRLLLIDLLSHNDDSMREKYADLWLGFNLEEIERWLVKNGFTVITKRTETGEGLGVFIVLAEKN
jgi:ubiquinone/menaquinone biosynthesis C-methylase UbiE